MPFDHHTDCEHLSIGQYDSLGVFCGRHIASLVLYVHIKGVVGSYIKQQFTSIDLMNQS